MALFFIAATPTSASAIKPSIEQAYQDRLFNVAAGQWIVSDNGKTAEQVAKALGIGEDPAKTALVLGISTYWGRHSRDLWPWMKEQLERRDG